MDVHVRVCITLRSKPNNPHKQPLGFRQNGVRTRSPRGLNTGMNGRFDCIAPFKFMLKRWLLPVREAEAKCSSKVSYAVIDCPV